MVEAMLTEASGAGMSHACPRIIPQEDALMDTALSTGAIHHLRLTVTDVARSRVFYTEILGFEVTAEIPPGVLLTNGVVTLGLGPPPDPEQAPPSDQFSENRVGLDHLSLSVATRADLGRFLERFEAHGVPHSGISDLPHIGFSLLAFRDPDNIQLELAVPYIESE
jgi:catechol 2,3-dioxygenase-like lactoylglutathione lyase family enzyme